MEQQRRQRGWSLRQDQIVLERDYLKNCHYPANSPPVVFPKESDHPRQLQLFEGRVIEELEERTLIQERDEVWYIGGSVWCMDWCAKDVSHDESMYLAVGVHPTPIYTSTMGVKQRGPAVIQLWRVGVENEEEECVSSLTMCICHGGQLTYDLKWSPSPRFSSDDKTLGLLGCILGDGSAVTYLVPHPEVLQERLNGVQQEDPVCARLPCHTLIQQETLEKGLPLCMDWLPLAQYDWVLLGFTNGDVAVVELGEELEGFGKKLVHTTVNSSGIRVVKWAPTEMHNQRKQETGHSLHFCVFTVSGEYMIFDMQVLDSAWLADPPQILVCTETGIIKKLLLSSEYLGREAFIQVCLDNGPIWCMDVHNKWLIFGTDTGQVGGIHGWRYSSAKKAVELDYFGAISTGKTKFPTIFKSQQILHDGNVYQMFKVKEVPGMQRKQCIASQMCRVYSVAVKANKSNTDMVCIASGTSAGFMRIQWMELIGNE
eukprot:TRINITY_DN20296_c0_g1_i1.p1 TRINITY_DN20296_c0_g1~~TRINITY_DN20296_c0_g1_i1.p1  ORF type:complete len:485 (-),score=52.94 TRINITY_DN20296_c0_g1_i1:640-2094(-)